MTRNTAIHNLFVLKLRSRDLSDKVALDLAMNALEQTKKITLIINKLDLEDISLKDFDNMFYLQSVNEIKEEMWMLYHAIENIKNTLNNTLKEGEENE